MNRLSVPKREVNIALVRLANDPDFKEFIGWLKEERDASIDKLIDCPTTIQAHQLQGCSRTLVEILQTIESAPIEVARPR